MTIEVDVRTNEINPSLYTETSENIQKVIKNMKIQIKLFSLIRVTKYVTLKITLEFLKALLATLLRKIESR